MSEKEVAIVCFPLPDGRFDYLRFTSKNEAVHKWCKDAFQYYWDNGRDRQILAEELYTWIITRPKAVQVLENLRLRKEVLHGEEVIPELEAKSLIKQGRTTILGDLVYVKLRQKT